MDNIFGFILIIGGTLSIIFPEKINSLDKLFIFKKTKPNELSIKLTRIGGFIIVALGIITFL